MRIRLNGCLGLSVLAVAATLGCSSSTPSGSSNAGGSGNGGTAGSGGTTGAGGNTQASTTNNCTSVTPCGGSVVGTWNVNASCLAVSGDMDVYSVGMGCKTVPVTGTLQVTGTWTANADGTYTDGTTTKGSITFPMDSSCKSISSVPVTCAKAATIFSALGWSATCTDGANSGCSCTATVNQNGGIGNISQNASPTGGYVTSGSSMATEDMAPASADSPNALKYSYCISGDTFTLSPQRTAVFPANGTITLQKSGTSGTGGASSTGGAGAGGGGVGGATATGGTVASGGKTGAGGAFTGGITGAGGDTPSTGGKIGTSTTGGGGPTGGSSAKGGSAAVGGTTTAGGSTATGGATTAGGASATGGANTAGTSATLPCDIYDAASMKCVAAHSTVRALYGKFSGALYQVKRASDSKTQDINVLAPGGYADAASQDTFCTGTTCTITKVYDQSGNGNFVEAETPDSSVGGNKAQTAANATQEPLQVGGHKVYSLYMKTSQAYWRDGSKSGMPTGSSPQGIYMVTSGKHYGSGCCFDYGNGETSRTYVAGPTMDAVNFSNCTIWGTGAGTGPWVMADLEGGLYVKGSSGQNTNVPTMTYTYVTAMEKNNGQNKFALKGADATTGTLSTFYEGALPGGYGPNKKQGSIVLGSGGDCCYSNNTMSQGTFYEGAIVAGYPTDATDAAIQANIVSAQYGK